MTSERQAYVYVQLPGTLTTVPAALLKVESSATVRSSAASDTATITWSAGTRSSFLAFSLSPD